jgi:hypothetical protein
MPCARLGQRHRGRHPQAGGAGKLLTVCAADVYAVDTEGQKTLCATLLGTARNISAAAGNAPPPQ